MRAAMRAPGSQVNRPAAQLVTANQMSNALVTFQFGGDGYVTSSFTENFGRITLVDIVNGQTRSDSTAQGDVATPEPASYVLMGGGLALCEMRRRRRSYPRGTRIARYYTGCMRIAAALFAAILAARAQDLPLTGISHVNFRVTDLEKARQFYTGLLGYPQAFSTGRNGAVGTAYLKVNDEQYIEISPGLQEGVDQRLTHVSFVTTDIEKLHEALTGRGLSPTALRPPGGDGTRGIRVTDPFGFPLEFTEYLPGSEHAKARGKFEDAQRISTHLLHAGIPVPREKLDEAVAYYRDKLGFREFWRGGNKEGEIDWINLRTPGTRGDYVELMIYQGTPTRTQLGTMEHVALEVPDIQKAFRTLMGRGAPAETAQPKIGRNGKWQLNLFDPDGSRTELMEPGAAKQ